MRKRLRRYGLMALAMLPIASVAFAAKSALSSAQIGKKGVPTHLLARGSGDSKGS